MKRLPIILVVVAAIIAVGLFYSGILSSSVSASINDRDKPKNASAAVSLNVESRSSGNMNGETAGNASQLAGHRELIDFAKQVRGSLPKDLPKSMADVEITPGLRKFLDDYPYGYEKIDYRLRLFDNLDKCLGEQEPQSGKIVIEFLFELDRDRFVAVGSDGNGTDYPGEPFRVRRYEISEEEKELVMSCLQEGHVGSTMDIKRMIEDGDIAPDNRGFVHPITIKFPLEEDDIYWILSHDGQDKPK